MRQPTIKSIIISRLDDIVPTPEATDLRKIIHSDSKDPDQASIIEIKTPFSNHSRLRFEHVIKAGQNADRYANGGIGVVKKLFEEKRKVGSPEKPIGAVKILKKKDASENKKSVQYETKYNCLLGREVIWGTMNGKFYIFMPWITGMSLRDYKQHLQNHAKDSKHSLPFPYPSIQQRLKMFRNYLKQAKLFHGLGLILGDPKTRNAMVDFEHETIELLDFDGVHILGTKGYSTTVKYLPPKLITKNIDQVLEEYSQEDDIFIFGHMLAELFPEFFIIEFDEKTPRAAKLTIKKTPPSPFETLEKLVQSMMAEEPTDRPSIDKCLEALQDSLEQSHLEEKIESRIDIQTRIINERVNKVLLEEFFFAIKDNDFPKLQVILEIQPEFINKLYEDKDTKCDFTPLMYAARFGRIDIFKFLVEKGADIFAKNSQGLIVEDFSIAPSFLEIKSVEIINHAFINGDYEKIKAVYSCKRYKKIINQRVQDGKLPLIEALKLKVDGGKQEEIISFLLKEGADIFVEDNQGRSALSTLGEIKNLNDVQSPSLRSMIKEKFLKALRRGKIDEIKKLLDKIPGLINEWFEGHDFRSTPLMIAAYNSRKEIVKLLLSRKADVFVKNLQNQTAETIKDKMDREIVNLLQSATLFQAIEKQNARELEAVLNRSQDKNLVNKMIDGQLPLVMALEVKYDQGDKEKIISSLLAKGADIFVKDHKGICALSTLGEIKNLNDVQSSSLRAAIKNKFFIAVRDGNMEIVEILLNKIPGLINEWFESHNYKSSPLMIAAYNNQKEIVKLLLSKKADVFAKNLQNQTAETIKDQMDSEIVDLLQSATLSQAIEKHNFAEIEALLHRTQNKSIVNEVLENDRLPLTMALELKDDNSGNQEKIIELLLTQGANIFFTDGTQRSALSTVGEIKKLNDVQSPSLRAAIKNKFFEAVRDGDITTMERLINQVPGLINEPLQGKKWYIYPLNVGSPK